MTKSYRFLALSLVFVAFVIVISTISSVNVFAQNTTQNVNQNSTQQNLTTLFNAIMNNTNSSSSGNTTNTLPYTIFIKELSTMNKSSTDIMQPLANTLTNNFTTHTFHFILPEFPIKGLPIGWKPYHPPHATWIHHAPQTENEIIPQGQLGSEDTPQEIWNAYGLNSLSCSMTGYQWGDPHLCGYGEVVAIIDAYDNPNIAFDLNEFDTQFGLPSCTSSNGCFTEFDYGGTPATPTGDDEDWISETDLDVEWVHAIAPGAAIDLVQAASSGDLIAAAEATAVLGGVNQVSMSWGAPEFQDETQIDPGFKVSGVSFIAAIGDHGDNLTTDSNSPEYPGVSPYVIAVGGTVPSFNNGNFQNEIAWSLNYGGVTGWGTGGGLSLYEPEPSYQSNYDIFSYNKRGTPDVSASAWNIPIFDSYDTLGSSCTILPSDCWDTDYGTSGAAPKWAGIIAIANSEHPSNPLSSASFGTLNAIYHAAIGRPYGQNYRDITSGQNGNCGYCNAGIGYDFVTGLGSPQANNLLSFLSPNAASAPSIPQNLVVSTSNNQITISWQTPASNGGSTIQDFNIYRGTSSGGETLLLTAPATASQTSYVDTTATFGVTYYYYVTAVNSVGESSNSNEVSAIINCLPPNSGDWTISQNCLLSSSVTAPANVIVQSNSVLTIPNGDALNMDFYHHHLLVKSGSGVLIKAGGTISQIEPTSASVTISSGASLTGGTCSTTNCFDPDTAIISTGGTVTWTNDDSVGHTATSGKPTDNTTGTIFDSSLIKAGGSFTSPPLTTVGIYNYFCQVHPWMTGEITVR